MQSTIVSCEVDGAVVVPQGTKQRFLKATCGTTKLEFSLQAARFSVSHPSPLIPVLPCLLSPGRCEFMFHKYLLNWIELSRPAHAGLLHPGWQECLQGPGYGKQLSEAPNKILLGGARRPFWKLIPNKVSVDPQREKAKGLGQ